MDDNWLSGGCQILRFPGFIVSPDRKQVYKDCTVYCSTVEMAKHLPEHERWRTLNWYKQTHNPKGADYRTFYLSMNDKQIGRGGSAA
jgi:hypothetical protein